jgi:hypothetical protein
MPPVTFLDACRMVAAANAILPMMPEEFVLEFRARVYTIGEAIRKENGWTERQLAILSRRPDLILDIELGEKSAARLLEFGDWFAENGKFALDI